jgi:hypothetical protein
MPSHLLKHAHGLPLNDHPWLLGLVDVGTAFWLILYVLAIVGGLRARSYEIPLVAIAANFSWELIAAVYRVAPVRLWHVGDVLWLGLDAGIVYTVLRYGRQQQQIPEIRRAFYPVVGVTFAFALIAQLALEQALDDAYGFLDAYLISVMMSVLFYFLYFSRRVANDINYAMAWCKLLGNGLTSAGFVFLYPLLDGPAVSRFLLYALCVANFSLDAGYVFLLSSARRAASAPPGAASSSSVASAA